MSLLPQVSKTRLHLIPLHNHILPHPLDIYKLHFPNKRAALNVVSAHAAEQVIDVVKVQAGHRPAASAIALAVVPEALRGTPEKSAV